MTRAAILSVQRLVLVLATWSAAILAPLQAVGSALHGVWLISIRNPRPSASDSSAFTFEWFLRYLQGVVEGQEWETEPGRGWCEPDKY